MSLTGGLWRWGDHHSNLERGLAMPFTPLKPLNLTDSGSVSNATIASTEKGMAHFAGSHGSAHKCRDCKSFRKPSEKSRIKICHQYGRMTGDWKKKNTGAAFACRHFGYGPEKKA